MRQPPLCCLILATVSCSDAVIRTTSESEANRAVAVLERHDVPADVEASTRGRETRFDVVVGRSDAARARAVLGAHGLPRGDRGGLAAASAGGGIVPSPVEERARMAGAIATELERSLESVDGVVEARVHVAFPLAGDPSFSHETAARPARASVLIRHAGAVEPLSDDDVRRLAAGAVDSLDRAAVDVVFHRVVVPPAPEDAWEPLGPFTVRTGSRGPLLGILLGLLATVATLSGLLVWTRVSSRRRKAPEVGPSA